MATALNLTRDKAGQNTFGLTFSDIKFNNILEAAGGAKDLEIPASHTDWLVVFAIEPGAQVWVARNAVATIPAAGEFVQTASELNPVARQVKGGDTLSILTTNVDAQIGVMLYTIDKIVAG